LLGAQASFLVGVTARPAIITFLAEKRKLNRPSRAAEFCGFE